MTQPPGNSEFNISDSTFNGPFAAGHHARAVQHIAGNQTAGPELAQLGVLLAQHRAQLTDPVEADAEYAVLTRQLALPAAQRDQRGVFRALARIGRNAAAVAAIVAGVEKLYDVVD